MEEAMLYGQRRSRPFRRPLEQTKQVIIGITGQIDK
jgi:hypothetical protein